MTVTDFASMASDPCVFRTGLAIDRDGSQIPFTPDVWQAADFTALDAGWLAAAGRGGDKPIMRGWLERPRGHSKTSDLAVMCCWALTFAAHPLRGIAAAADRDQAGLLRDAIGRLVRLNPWLAKVLEVQALRVVNSKTGATLEIISSDVATSWGVLPDFIVADEVSHWPEGRGEGLWQSLLSSAAKRGNCLLVVISNAGFQDSWAFRVREAVRTDFGWHFHALDGAQASWISRVRLAEQERLLPPLAYDRLWRNRWVPGSGDALPAELIEAAVTLVRPQLAPEAGWIYTAGLDLSLRRDRSAFAIVGRRGGKLRLAHLREWIPPRGGTIDLQAIQAHVRERCRCFRAKAFIDPYQGELMHQQLRAAGIRCQLVPFVGATLHTMATALIEVFRDRRIALFPHPTLLADLRRLRVVERPQGFRLDAPRTREGHCDSATALTLAVHGVEQGDPAPTTKPRMIVPGFGFPPRRWPF